MARLILLPGMDGTGELFAPLLQFIPAAHAPWVIAYPTDRFLSYAALLVRLEEQLQSEQALTLLAESFSGPLALRLAAAHPGRVHAVILCASFVLPPLPRWLAALAGPCFHLPPPAWGVRHLLVGPAAGATLVRQVQQAIAQVPRQVMAQRLAAVAAVDCTDALRCCRAPILYLAGSQDRMIRPCNHRRIQALRPDVHVRSLPGPHLLLEAQPAAAWHTIETFLRSDISHDSAFPAAS